MEIKKNIVYAVAHTIESKESRIIQCSSTHFSFIYSLFESFDLFTVFSVQVGDVLSELQMEDEIQSTVLKAD